jgi:hypothetical protein
MRCTNFSLQNMLLTIAFARRTDYDPSSLNGLFSRDFVEVILHDSSGSQFELPRPGA